MRTKLVAGNWKMNAGLAGSRALLEAVRAGVSVAEVTVCVPFPYLGLAREVLQGSAVAWGAQNASQHPHGAYTGEVSAGMVAEFGARHVIVGHSERRAMYGEDDEIVAAKFSAVQSVGLVPIFCVGETLAERDAGDTERIVGAQLDAVLQGCGAAALDRAVVAYEPVWAIGTGKTASPDQAQGVHRFIRARIGALDAGVAGRVRILYGGSVKAQNAEDLFGMPDVDGGLIGGASLVAEDFLAIARAAGQH